MERMRRTGLLLVCVIGAACSEPAPLSNPLLAFVPDDSAYLLVSGQPLPESYLGRLREFQESMKPILESSLEESLVAAQAPFDDEARSALTRLLTSLTFQFSSIGGEDQPLVVYTRGLTPILRTRLADTADLESVLAELVSSGGIEAREESGTRYWRTASGAYVALLSLSEGTLAAGFTTIDDEDGLREHLLSPARAGGGAGITRTLDEIRTKHEFGPYALAYVESADLVARLAQNLKPACAEQLRGIARAVPRLVSGYDEISERSLTSRLVLELDSSVTEQLAGWSVPMAGLGQTGALFSFGFAVDAPEVLKTALRWQQQLESNASGCEAPLIDGLDASVVPKAMFGLGAVGNPQGVLVSLDGMPENVATSTDWSLSALLQAQSAQATALLASQAVPLDALLTAGGKPVQLDLPASTPVAVDAWGILTDKALGVATGKDAAQRLQKLVEAPPGAEGTLLAIEFDARIMEALTSQLESGPLADLIQAEAAEAQGDEAAEKAAADAQEELQRNLAMMRLYGELLDHVSMSVRTTPLGLEIRQAASMR